MCDNVHPCPFCILVATTSFKGKCVLIAWPFNTLKSIKKIDVHDF